jgi:hypothetical protein
VLRIRSCNLSEEKQRLAHSDSEDYHLHVNLYSSNLTFVETCALLIALMFSEKW